jgi:hypothetical protein
MTTYIYTPEELSAVAGWKEQLTGIRIDRERATRYNSDTGDISLPFVGRHERVVVNRQLAKMVLNLRGMGNKPSEEIKEEVKEHVDDFVLGIVHKYGVKIVNRDVLYGLFPSTLDTVLPVVEEMIGKGSVDVRFYFSDKNLSPLKPFAYAELGQDEDGNVNVNVEPYLLLDRTELIEPTEKAMLRAELRKTRQREIFVNDLIRYGIVEKGEVPIAKLRTMILEATPIQTLEEIMTKSSENPAGVLREIVLSNYSLQLSK